ncbi:hypothetical protein [Polaribacter sp. IC073]|uniref:hypothetical protein n=1 Tax=Polaribacter sp. IC073 TaxID=2508540 RepID=UPI0011BE73AE|nr:hypothetical protein [Polaribacter sp. IC073]TXD45889.1 hypothetical protein ES045_15810 [Polaribacter sp. IC073]
MIDATKLIGRHKYAALKKYDFEKMSTMEMVEFRKTFKISVSEAIKKIEEFENSTSFSGPNVQAIKEYSRKLNRIGVVKEMKITKETLWVAFLRNFKLLEKKDFVKTEDILANLAPLFYYFTDDFSNFEKCKRLSNLSVPSFDKGILIIGDFGNGKSSTMKVFEKCVRNTPKYFKGYSANDVVLDFEGCSEPKDKTHLIKKMSTGKLYFDDIKSERKANNYGKSEIFREILENRYNNKALTFITCNYKKGYEGNLETALKEFGEKYGDRVNDRIYEMFNVIEFKGKSFRK